MWYWLRFWKRYQAEKEMTTLDHLKRLLTQ